MNFNVLTLRNKSLKGPLDAAEIAWLERQTQLYPYFSLPWFILARTKSGKEGEQLLKSAAALAPDRNILKDFILGKPGNGILRQAAASGINSPVKEEIPPAPKAPPAVEEKPVAAADPPPLKKDVPAGNIPLIETKVVALPEPVKINWNLHTRVESRSMQYLRMAKKIRDQVREGLPETPAQGQVEEIQKPQLSSPLPSSPEKTAGNHALSPPVVLPPAKDSPGQEGETYQIGSLSDFAFLEDPDSGNEGELNEHHDRRDSVEINLREEGGTELHEISMKGGSGTLTILATPEELKQYFLEVPAGEPGTGTEETAGDRERRERIIRKFIEEEPVISRLDPTAQISPGDLAKASVEEDESLVTETLAQIHERQGNYRKAVKIYERLSLIFPEKKAYFASLIQKLKR